MRIIGESFAGVGTSATRVIESYYPKLDFGHFWQGDRLT